MNNDLDFLFVSPSQDKDMRSFGITYPCRLKSRSQIDLKQCGQTASKILAAVDRR